MAKKIGNKDIIDFLISLDNNKIIKNTETLFNAIHSGDVLSAENAIKNTALINLMDTNGDTPLMNAISDKYTSIVKLLLNNGANTNIKNEKKGYTALILTAKDGNTEDAKLLIDHCAYINAKVKIGITPLMIASYYGNTDIVKLLLDNDADINIIARNGDTALSIARSKGYKEIVDLLTKNSPWNNVMQQLLKLAQEKAQEQAK